MQWEGFRKSLANVPAGGAFVLAVAMFAFSLTAVFYGFVGYYSRVNLSAELQKDGKNLDVLFMRIEQLEQDEAQLKLLRQRYVEAQKEVSNVIAGVSSKAYTSPEYASYVEMAGKATAIVAQVRDLVSDDYWAKVLNLDYRFPRLDQAQLFASPEFRGEVAKETRIKLYEDLSPVVQSLRIQIVAYEGKFGSYATTGADDARYRMQALSSSIREILLRNPHWISGEDRQVFNLTSATTTAADDTAQAIEKQRAVIRSYRGALGWGSSILQWPTIVSTLIVTMAAGWLGGIVNFLGAAIRSGDSARREAVSIHEPHVVVLLRRSILAATAALGIFLFAGSGLLVLTSQTGTQPGQGPIELNPYFVAFLAFISGFLADDAFLRMAKAGRAFFRTEADDSDQPAQPDGQDQPQPQQREHQ